MRESLRTYRLRLETLAPVFIGSGGKINKKEYILDGEEALIPDMRKMYEGLRRAGLAGEYEDYLLNRKGGDLGIWLERNRIGRETYLPWIAYTLDSGDVDFDRENPKREVMTFVKDAYGCPYVPGSSVKGMLRTVLLASELMTYPEKYDGVKRSILSEQEKAFQKERPDRRYLQREKAEMEQTAFHILQRPDTKKADAVNDLFAAIRIGDSRPLSTEDLVLCQKVDMKPDGKEKYLPKYLPLARECLKPGIFIECDLTVDEGMLHERNVPVLTPEKIMNAVSRFHKMYQEVFRGKFKDMPESDMQPGDEEESRSVYLGGGCGFLSKTEVYPMFGGREGVKNTQEIFRRTLGKQYRQHKHDLDAKRNVSPHVYKLTYYRDQAYEMGKCRISIE